MRKLIDYCPRRSERAADLEHSAYGRAVVVRDGRAVPVEASDCTQSISPTAVPLNGTQQPPSCHDCAGLRKRSGWISAGCKSEGGLATPKNKALHSGTCTVQCQLSTGRGGCVAAEGG
jgi:hypothetical protein